jgi:hypothetical protein
VLGSENVRPSNVAQSHERPVLHHVVLVLARPRPLLLIYALGTVSQNARIRDTIPNGEIKAVGSQHIPGKFAADVETARQATFNVHILVPASRPGQNLEGGVGLECRRVFKTAPTTDGHLAIS